MSEEKTDEVTAELCAIVKREGVAEVQQATLISAFAPFHAEIAKTRNASMTITSGENPIDRKLARECRLELRRTRCNVENARKEAKADALRYGKAVDGMANVLKFLCEPEENRLEEIEKAEERKEAARIAAIVEERTAQLIEAEANPAAYNLASMDDATWDLVITAARKAKADRIETERKAEAERIAQAEAERKERERINAENARLKAEADKREKEIEAERKKAREEAEAAQRKADEERKQAEAKAAKAKAEADAELAKVKAQVEKERLAREAIETAERIKREKEAEAERKKQEEEKRASEEAAKAPDKKKFKAFSDLVGGMEVPQGTSAHGKQITKGIENMFAKMCAWIDAETEKL